VSEPSESGRSLVGEPSAAEAPGAPAGEAEQVSRLPVLAREATVVRTHSSPGGLSGDGRPAYTKVPAVQAAAAAAGGFVAGAAIVGLLTRRQRRSSALLKGRRAGREMSRGARRPRAVGRAGELVQIVGSRSLLVDVHLLGGRD
jgi:hypothetical protein